MNFKLPRSAAIAALAMIAAGCDSANKPIGQVDPYFGEAARYNAAIQTINPDPVYTANSALPGYMAAKSAEAVKRYRTDQVNERHRTEAASVGTGLSTTQSVGSSSGPR